MLKNAGPEFVSGEEMAKSLYVTRAGIWKAVRTLEREGCDIEAVTNRGYRLKPRKDYISSEAVEADLKGRGLEVKVFYYEETDSTNLRAQALSGEYDGNLLVIAGAQTKGRGRKGRSFFSPEDTGIYMSFLLRNGESMAELSNITANAAVATARAIDSEAFGGRDVTKIKWVNDLYLGDRKVTGILSEGFTDLETGGFSVVIGIGINVFKPSHGFPDDIRDKAGSLEEGGARLTADVRNRIISETVANIMYFHANPKESLKIYRDKSNLMGCYVKINTFTDTKAEKYAKVTGIDEDCHLLVEYDDGRREALSSGEVSVVKY